MTKPSPSVKDEIVTMQSFSLSGWPWLVTAHSDGTWRIHQIVMEEDGRTVFAQCKLERKEE
jgi:hypothetical protein